MPDTRYPAAIRVCLIFCIWGFCNPQSAICNPAVPAVRDFAAPAVTSKPFTYGIWYLPEPNSPKFLKPLEASPPDLFHLGYQIPFKGALGPTYGHELFSDAILPPAEIPREVARDKEIVANMRAAGVGEIIPYVYTMAFFGNPDKRTGFFHFFDHWDEYRDFGLGPKPAGDPTLWLQEPGPHPLGGGPPDVLHYDPCVNHPAWREYLDLVVRQLAAVGYDGMFFDVNTQYCYCPHCEEAFDIYLLAKYSSEGLREAFGTCDARKINLSKTPEDVEELVLEGFNPYLARVWAEAHLADVLDIADPAGVALHENWRAYRCYVQDSQGEYPPRDDLPGYLRREFGGASAREISPKMREEFTQTVLRYWFRNYLESPNLDEKLRSRFGSSDLKRACCGTPKDLLLWAETQRFWCDSIAGTFSRLKADGRKIFAEQGRARDFYTVGNLGSMATVDGFNKRRVDGIQLDRWAPMADMQMFEEMPQPGSLESGVIISNVLPFRWAMAAGTHAGTLLYQVGDDLAADLANAEAAAGGGGAFIQPGLYAPEARKRWKRFFAERADLWDGGASWAKVAVLFWSGQMFYEYPEHLAVVHRLVRILAENQIPFDIVTERGLDTLAKYPVAIAPMLRYLDTPETKALLRYASDGGDLVVIPPFGTEDAWARPRKDPLLGDGPGIAARGKGRILMTAPTSVPERRSDLWCMMEERGGDFPRMETYLNKTRHEDLKNRVDLGPTFVAGIEKTLGVNLRWCPPETDAGVYVHAYRLPAKNGRAERVVVHALNYRLPINLQKPPHGTKDTTWAVQTRSGTPQSARDVRIRVPLPPKTRVKSVAVATPTERAPKIDWRSETDAAEITIPKLRLYQAIEIELEDKP